MRTLTPETRGTQDGMAEKSLLRESVWFDQAKFETAEARYQQVIAERHSALKVEVRDERTPIISKFNIKVFCEPGESY